MRKFEIRKTVTYLGYRYEKDAAAAWDFANEGDTSKWVGMEGTYVEDLGQVCSECWAETPEGDTLCAKCKVTEKCSKCKYLNTEKECNLNDMPSLIRLNLTNQMNWDCWRYPANPVQKCGGCTFFTHGACELSDLTLSTLDKVLHLMDWECHEYEKREVRL